MQSPSELPQADVRVARAIDVAAAAGCTRMRPVAHRTPDPIARYVRSWQGVLGGQWARSEMMIRRQGRMACRRIRSVDALSPGTSSIAKVVTKSAVRDQIDEVAYWAGVSLEERVAAVEVLRRRMYGGNDGVRPRLQRVCRVTRSA